MSVTQELQHVFVLQGIPSVTFVQPVEYANLVTALKTPGRGIVIEGPSGIGKTTAVFRALEETGLSEKVISVSARKKDDADLVKNLPQLIPFGTVIIDDFHRLDEETKRHLADLMKTLADEGGSHSKVIVLGIPNAGQSLISFGRDLANRIEIIPFEVNPEHKVDELIRKGEDALNIVLNIRDEIVKASQGSFYIAQMLCHEACLRSGITKTAVHKQETKISFELIKSNVMQRLSRSFHEITVSFCRGTKLRREGRAPYLHLLNWLSQSKSWAINTEREADRHKEQRGSVTQVVTKGFLKDLIESSEDIQKVLHFDAANSVLVAQDPQFIFYIRNLSWHQLSEDVGFISLEFPNKYDFALSFAGTEREIAKALFEKLQEAELEVFYDFNEQHRILAEDVEEYLAPIYSSDALFVVCILGPEYPKKIWTRFESKQFKERFKSGEVIPVVLDTVQPSVFDETARVGHFRWESSAALESQINALVDLLLKKCADKRRSSA